MKNILVFFDQHDYTGDEFKEFQDSYKVFLSKNRKKQQTTTFKFIDDRIALVKDCPFYDVVFIDFGGMGYGSVELFVNIIENKIADNPNTEFIILCTMGIDWYKGYFEKEYPNLKYFDRDYERIFNYLFMEGV
jgi:hypothetical protein